MPGIALTALGGHGFLRLLARVEGRLRPGLPLPWRPALGGLVTGVVLLVLPAAVQVGAGGGLGATSSTSGDPLDRAARKAGSARRCSKLPGPDEHGDPHGPCRPRGASYGERTADRSAAAR